MKLLPIVRIRRKYYFVDKRLRQLRNMENVHDYLDFKDVYALQDYLQEQKAVWVVKE